jgi:peroxiredoxin Q/BCP
MAKLPQPGDRAPDFELSGTDGPFRLSAHRGERVVLLFYPADNSLVCTRQFCAYRDQFELFMDYGVRAVGIAPQSLASHRDFIARHALTLPLLADVGHVVAKLYNAHSPLLGTKRASIVIGADGIVGYRHDRLFGLGYDSVEDLGAALAGLV